MTRDAEPAAGTGTPASARAFRFGVGAPSAVSSRQELVEHARFAESSGFSVASFPDHFFLPLAPLVALMTVAEVTSRLRVGTLLLAAGFRHPALLAKELATADLLSDGRLEVGLGAGWMESEHLSAGLPFGTPAERLARLVEIAEILKLAWSSDRISYSGEHYGLHEVPSAPRPVQPGGPPLLMGGGMRRIITASAKIADIVTIAPGPIGFGSASNGSHSLLLSERATWIRDALAASGRSPELHMLLFGVVVCDDRYVGARKCLDTMNLDSVVSSGRRQEEERALLESPFFAIGTAREIADQLRQTREEFGVSYFSVREAAAKEFVPIVESLAGT